MLSCQHRLEVLPEEELGFAAELRGNDVNRLMGIDGHEAGLGQLLCQAGPTTCMPSRQTMVSTMVLVTYCWTRAFATAWASLRRLFGR